MYRTTLIFCQFTGVNLIELNWLGHNKILLLYLVVEGCALPYMVVHAYEDLLASILLFMLCMSIEKFSIIYISGNDIAQGFAGLVVQGQGLQVAQCSHTHTNAAYLQ